MFLLEKSVLLILVRSVVISLVISLSYFSVQPHFVNAQTNNTVVESVSQSVSNCIDSSCANGPVLDNPLNFHEVVSSNNTALNQLIDQNIAGVFLKSVARNNASNLADVKSSNQIIANEGSVQRATDIDNLASVFNLGLNDVLISNSTGAGIFLKNSQQLKNVKGSVFEEPLIANEETNELFVTGSVNTVGHADNIQNIDDIRGSDSVLNRGVMKSAIISSNNTDIEQSDTQDLKNVQDSDAIQNLAGIIISVSDSNNTRIDQHHKQSIYNVDNSFISSNRIGDEVTSTSSLGTRIVQISDQNFNNIHAAVGVGASNSVTNRAVPTSSKETNIIQTSKQGISDVSNTFGSESNVGKNSAVSEIASNSKFTQNINQNIEHLDNTSIIQNDAFNNIKVTSSEGIVVNQDVHQTKSKLQDVSRLLVGDQNDVLVSENSNFDTVNQRISREDGQITGFGGHALPPASGNDAIMKEGSDNNNVIQELDISEKSIDHSKFSTTGKNSATLEGNSDNNNVIQEDDQSIKRCFDNSNCENDSINNIEIRGADNNRVVQVSDQEITCQIGSECTNTASNDGFIDGEGQNNQLEMSVKQNEVCLFDSVCSNKGQAQVSISDQSGQQVKTNIDQNNLCVRHSSCSNGGLADTNNPSNKQENTCVNDSQCKNGGNNDKTLCVNGSSCENNGKDTNVISNHADCSNGPDGSTTICRSGSNPIVIDGTTNSAANIRASTIPAADATS